MPHDASTTTASIAVLTVSDTRSIEEDQSGERIIAMLTDAGHSVAKREIVKDDVATIQSMMTAWIDCDDVEVIIVSGGTGPSVRDITPDAIVPMFTSVMPGFGELFRQLSYQEIGAASMLSRAEAGWIDVAGVRKLIFLLPGSPRAIHLALEALIIPQLGHLLDMCQLESTQ